MTQEQYNRAVEISENLKKLENLKKGIERSPHSPYFPYSHEEWLGKGTVMENIKDIINRHSEMIRKEIDNEIEKLKKEIEEL